MPYQIVELPSENVESIGATTHHISEELKGLRPGESVLGYLGPTPPGMVKDVVQEEVLNPKAKQQKKELHDFLVGHLTPPVLSQSHNNPGADRQRFLRKFNKMPFVELRRFWSGKLPREEDITEEFLADLQAKFEDISP